MRDWSAKVNFESLQSGSGLHELSVLEANGLQPPKQKAPVPQNPNSLQHGAEEGQGDVALQAVASVTPTNAARNSGKPMASSDGIIVQTTIVVSKVVAIK
jgi:hypothetical protein